MRIGDPLSTGRLILRSGRDAGPGLFLYLYVRALGFKFRIALGGERT